MELNLSWDQAPNPSFSSFLNKLNLVAQNSVKVLATIPTNSLVTIVSNISFEAS